MLIRKFAVVVTMATLTNVYRSVIYTGQTHTQGNIAHLLYEDHTVGHEMYTLSSSYMVATNLIGRGEAMKTALKAGKRECGS